jgi:hypothetical protein
MFIAQLAAFLVAHHHQHWIPGLFTSTARFVWLSQWAARHGFTYQP